MPGDMYQVRDFPSSRTQSPVDKLDLPCLVRVLQLVIPQQQLVVCGAVCSKWRKATREAISSIDIGRCTQEKCDQLQQWAVDPPATLYSLSLHIYVHSSDSDQHPGLRLQLSVLQHLRGLTLHNVRLEALAADGSVLRVADLLPRLQRCTKLAFCAANQDPQLVAAVAAFKAMPAVQDLKIDCYNLSEDLAVLPTTLTQLCLTGAQHINSTSAAGILQLTGLRVLDVTAYGCDTSVLANCRGLERVILHNRVDAFSGEGGPIITPLLVFANMPSLQHLNLLSPTHNPVATAAEVAALSSSSNLTYLSLGDSEYYNLPPAAYDYWFPAGSQRPHLQHLHVGVGVLGNTAAVQRMVSACPGLKELDLQDPEWREIRLEPASVLPSLQALTSLTGLTWLCVKGRALPQGGCINPAVVDAWSHWSSLQQLDLSLWRSQAEDLLVLSQLRSLHKLALYVGDDEMGFALDLRSTQAGSQLDVWSQVPAAVWGATDS